MAQRRAKDRRVVVLTGSTEIHLPGGIVLRIDLSDSTERRSQGIARHGSGRPPSPATVRLRQVLEEDQRTGRIRSRAEYRALLAQAGHAGSQASANLIVSREAKRILGQLPSQSQSTPNARRGRKPSPEVVLIREKLAEDRASGNLREASHYVRWLVDQRGVHKGLKQLKPMVHRELRAHRSRVA